MAISFGWRGLRRLARTFSGVTSTPNPKNRWMVWPRTLRAATPVGARTTGVVRVFARKCSSSVDLPVPALPVTKRFRPPASMSSRARANSGLISIVPAGPPPRSPRFAITAALRPPSGRPQSGWPRKASSTGTRKPFARRLVSFARAATAISSANISSVMPFALAPAVWLWMQYSQLLVALTAT